MKNEDEKRAKSEEKTPKRPYRKPEIESTKVFETFTLQSCNLSPDDDCIGLFE